MHAEETEPERYGEELGSYSKKRLLTVAPEAGLDHPTACTQPCKPLYPRLQNGFLQGCCEMI